MSEQLTTYEATTELAGSIELSATGSEWLKLPSGEYINMARVDTVSGPYDDTAILTGEPEQLMFLSMGHTTRTLRGDDIAGVLAYLDSVVLS